MSNHLYYIVASFTILFRPFVLKDFFIPTSRNGYRPVILRKGSIIIYALVLFLFNITLGNLTLSKVYAAVEVSKIVGLHNSERQKEGLSTLLLNSKLSASATAKAQAMLASDCWSHYCPNGKSPWDFFIDQNYDYVYAGENLAEGFNDNETVMQAWMNSPTHKANVLKPEFREIGIGIVSGSFQNNPNNTIIVVHFGTQVDSYYNLPETNNPIGPTTSVSIPLGAPTIDDPATGTSTSNVLFPVRGKTEKKSIVTILDNGLTKGSVSDEGGIYDFRPPQSMPYEEGLHVLSAYYTLSGDLSDRSAEVHITVDTTAPVIFADSMELISTGVPNAVRVRIKTNTDTYEVYLNINEEKTAFTDLPESDLWEGEINSENLSSDDVVKITAVDKAGNLSSVLINTGEVLSAINAVNSGGAVPLGIIQNIVAREAPTLKNAVSMGSLLILSVLFIADAIILARTNLPVQIVKSKFHFHLSSFLILIFAALIGGIGGDILQGITR